jgi:hypothetical protein
MKVPKSLVTASRIMAFLSYAGAALTPIVLVLAFTVPGLARVLDIKINHVNVASLTAIPLDDRLFALAFLLVPAGFAVWGLLALARLFHLFAQGQIFAPENMRALSQVSAALFWNVVTAFLMQAPETFFLSYHAGPGHREISLGLGSDDVEILFLAGATFVIARVMAEARRVADENESFV